MRQALLHTASKAPASTGFQHGQLHVAQRADVHTTLSAPLQQRADQLASCLTGQLSEACAALMPPDLASRYAARYECAAVRSVSIATLRQSDGALVAASHARSACSAAQMANTPRPEGCAPEAARALARPGRFAHRALRADDMVAATIKPLLADALRHLPGGGRWLVGAAREQMLQALANSDTAFFIDHLLCFGPGGDPSRCTGPQVLAQRISALQLSSPLDVAGPPGANPARAFKLPGLPITLPHWPPQGRNAATELAAAQRCHDQPEDQRWRAWGHDSLARQAAEQTVMPRLPLLGRLEHFANRLQQQERPVTDAVEGITSARTSRPQPLLWAALESMFSSLGPGAPESKLQFTLTPPSAPLVLADTASPWALLAVPAAASVWAPSWPSPKPRRMCCSRWTATSKTAPFTKALPKPQRRALRMSRPLAPHRPTQPWRRHAGQWCWRCGGPRALPFCNGQNRSHAGPVESVLERH